MFSFNPNAFNWGFWAGQAIALGIALMMAYIVILLGVVILIRDIIGKWVRGKQRGLK